MRYHPQVQVGSHPLFTSTNAACRNLFCLQCGYDAHEGHSCEENMQQMIHEKQQPNDPIRWKLEHRYKKETDRIRESNPALYTVANNARVARFGSLGMKDVTRWIAHCVATFSVGPADLLGPRYVERIVFVCYVTCLHHAIEMWVLSVCHHWIPGETRKVIGCQGM